MKYIIPWLTIVIMTQNLYAKVTEKKFRKQSPVTQVHLLELYSTQSCSSCPPAQEWVSKLKNSNQLWQKFVPIVFHVDYWDYLGWKDPYSQPQYSARQRQYAKEWQSSSAYTPMLVIDGQETHIK
ncbi:MAG: DUF1223 domain-containing protein, partial [Bdellovibrionales bacterium]|nr:DUF1223 domain-containing protein [Bdellovibrionales bacterium]